MSTYVKYERVALLALRNIAHCPVRPPAIEQKEPALRPSRLANRPHARAQLELRNHLLVLLTTAS